MAAYRTAAMSKWGTDTILEIEDTFRTLGKAEMDAMQTELNHITSRLTTLPRDPQNAKVQQCIARRHEIITRLNLFSCSESGNYPRYCIPC